MRIRTRECRVRLGDRWCVSPCRVISLAFEPSKTHGRTAPDDVMRWRAKPAAQVDRGLKQSFVETAGDAAEVLQAVEESAR